MRGVIFFVYLCFLLLRGGICVYNGVHHEKMSYPPAKYLDKKRRSNCTNTSLSFGIVKGIDAQHDEIVMCEDMEEDDDDVNAAEKKDRLNTKGNLLFPQALIINYLYACHKEKLLFYNHLPCKYITQRALRI